MLKTNFHNCLVWLNLILRSMKNNFNDTDAMFIR